MKVTPSALALDAEFGRSDGRAHHLRFKDFDPTKNADEIRAAMSKLTKLSIFDKNDVSLFDEVRHATVIEKREREIFDKKKETDTEPAAESVKEPVQPKAEPITQVKEPVKHIAKIEAVENIRFPEDLIITNDYSQTGWLIQTIELPMGINSCDISENQVFLLLNTCLPAGSALETIEADDQAIPAKLIITAKLQEDEPKLETGMTSNKESPPIKPMKRRKRLLERVRKRE